MKKLPYNPALAERAKLLRKSGNLAEVLFWNQVKKNQFHGLDFDRQKIIGNYIVDFFCGSYMFIVEIDGGSHIGKEEYDDERDLFLRGLDMKVLHISDEWVKKDIKGVLQYIEKEIISK